MDAWTGIDVSKDTLDACLLRESGKPLEKTFRNDAAGIGKLMRWADSHAPAASNHFCLESTGPYGVALAEALAEAGRPVSVENPARIKHFGSSRGAQNKTDKADAVLIAEYCRRMQPPVWRMAEPSVRILTALLHRLQSLQGMLTAEQNRLSQPGLLPEVRQSIEHAISFLQGETHQVRQQVHEHVGGHPELAADVQLLTSIPGIGQDTAQVILSELPDVRQFECAKDAATYAGLSPREHRSGSSVRGRTRLSKVGNGRLRAAMYMPAMSAIQHNPLVRDLYQRLLLRGKCRMAALAAAMRKLLMIAYGVLKHRKEFDVQFAQQTKAPA